MFVAWWVFFQHGNPPEKESEQVGTQVGFRQWGSQSVRLDSERNHETVRVTVEETDANDDSSVTSRTMITVNSSIQNAGERWVHKPTEEINLLVVLEDDTVRDL